MHMSSVCVYVCLGRMGGGWSCYLVEVISRKLKDCDEVGEISRWPVGEDDDLQATDQQ